MRALAAQVEASASAREQVAVAEERNRLRDDLHDIVGHHVNVAAVLADAARAAHGRDEQRLISSLENVAVACRSAHEAMERATRWLAVESGVEPTPSLQDLQEVVESVGLAGLQVRQHIGISAAEVERLDQVVSATATRFLREALTNVLKHSADRWCDIEVASEAETLVVNVTSAPVAASAPIPQSGTAGGSGLRRLRRRIELLGGTVTAHSANGGFCQEAIFPLRPQQTL